MKLPRGITGFRQRGEGELPSMDVLQFKTNCYEVARSVGGRIVGECEVSPVANYHAIALELDHELYGVLLNAHFPFLGFVCPPPSLSNPLCERFVDIPRVTAAFSALGTYEVLSSAVLNSVPTEEALTGLARVEFEQIRYWRPLRLGHIVFNAWD